MKFIEYMEFSKGGNTVCLKAKEGQLKELSEQFEGVVEVEAFRSLGVVVIEVK